MRLSFDLQSLRYLLNTSNFAHSLQEVFASFLHDLQSLVLFVICSHPVSTTQSKLRVQRAMRKQVFCIEDVGNALSSSHFFCIFP
jgi:hypothetical protein